jgi:hypothetical protein
VLLAVGATAIPLGLCSAPDKLDIWHLARTVGELYGLLNLTTAVAERIEKAATDHA